jgi:hypothetical protein
MRTLAAQLRAIGDSQRRTFAATALDRQLPMYESRADALTAVGAL